MKLFWIIIAVGATAALVALFMASLIGALFSTARDADPSDRRKR